MSPLGIAQVLLGPLTSLGEKWIGRKQAKDSLKAKAVMAKNQQATDVTLSDAEWETIATGKQDTTWKDEWVTIIFTLPVPGIFLGAVYGSMTGDTRLTEGVVEGIMALNNVGIPMDVLMTATVFAAIGLKLWRA